MAVSPDGLMCQSREQKEWHGCRSTKGVSGKGISSIYLMPLTTELMNFNQMFLLGKYYYEATVTDEGLCRVGWSTKEACLDLGRDKQHL